MTTLRPAAVAGTFYPSDPHQLATMVDTLLNQAIKQLAQAEQLEEGADLSSQLSTSSVFPKVLIVPHAGYIYSGAIAATGYAQCWPKREHICRIVLLGPAHRVHLEGIASAGVEAFATPLGQMQVDSAAEAMIQDLPPVWVCPEAHEYEHSLEVHLPFLQRLFPHASCIPLVVGDTSPADVAQVLEALWGGDETLIVISSDLSHFLTYATACKKDRLTCEAILNYSETIHPEQACGCMPLNGLMHLAKKKSLQPKLLDLRNSGDTAGDKSRVVGYASFGLYEASHGLA
ncbi:MAG: AmmeMemoRadiSam system protein B [Pseudomonadota bacterium]